MKNCSFKMGLIRTTVYGSQYKVHHYQLISKVEYINSMPNSIPKSLNFKSLQFICTFLFSHLLLAVTSGLLASFQILKTDALEVPVTVAVVSLAMCITLCSVFFTYVNIFISVCHSFIFGI